MDDINNKVCWNEDESKLFITYGNCFVPERAWQVDTICDMVPNPTEGAHLVDICCGEGILTSALIDKFPHAIVHALDASEAMLSAVKRKLSQYGGRHETKKMDLAARNWRKFPYKVHAFVSSLAIHHLEGEEKYFLFKDLFEALDTGGALIIADLIMPKTAQGIKTAAHQWDKIVKKQSYDTLQGDDGYEAFKKLAWNFFDDPYSDPIDKPSSVYEQLQWLEKAGYVGVDVFFFKAGHAIFGGFKG